MNLISRIALKPLTYLGLEVQPKPIFKPLKVDSEWLMHFSLIQELYSVTEGISGSVVECGIGYGHSFYKLATLASTSEPTRKMYGFDSFEGFPEPTPQDESPRAPKKGQWKVSTPQTIQQLLLAGGVPTDFIENNVTLIKGFFENTVSQYNAGPIAFLHLDVDLYQSYKDTLNYFWPLVANGGVVLFDEYRQADALERWPGAAKAIDEFFADTSQSIQHNKLADRYYIIKNGQ